MTVHILIYPKLGAEYQGMIAVPLQPNNINFICYWGFGCLL